MGSREERRQMAQELKSQLDGKSLDENIKDAIKTYEELFVKLQWIAKNMTDKGLKDGEIAGIQFIGHKAQAVGEMGKLFELTHKHLLDDVQLLP